jgi:hypothetical protein
MRDVFTLGLYKGERENGQRNTKAISANTKTVRTIGKTALEERPQVRRRA